MTQAKSNGVGGLKWLTIAAFLGLLMPILAQIAQVHVIGTRLADHMEACRDTLIDIKRDVDSHDTRIRENSNKIAKIEP